MKKVLLVFGILLLLVFLTFLVQKNKFSEENSNILEYNTVNVWNCVFEIYEGNDILENFQKQVGHATVLDNWLFLTNKHVVDLNKNYLLSGNWLSFYVDKIWFESGLDLAYIKWNNQINCDFKIKKSSTEMTVWQEIFTRVYENWEKQKKTGNIIWLNEVFEINGEYYTDLISTNLKLEYGDSGSPLFDIDGDIIWVNTAISQIDILSYTIVLQQTDISESIITID